MSAETADDQIGVGHSRLRSAPAVRRGARNRPCAARTNPKSATRIHPSETAASGTDCVDGDGRHPIGEAGDGSLEHDSGSAIDDTAHVGAGPAHIERDERRVTQSHPQRCRSDDTSSRTRQDDRRGEACCRRQTDQTTGAAHYGRSSADPHLGHGVTQRVEVMEHKRLQIGIDDRCRRSLELAELRGHGG